MMRSLILVLLASPAVIAGDLDSVTQILQTTISKEKATLHAEDKDYTEDSIAKNAELQVANDDLSNANDDEKAASELQAAAQSAASAAKIAKEKAGNAVKTLALKISQTQQEEKEKNAECKATLEDLQGSVVALRKAVSVLRSGSGSVDLMQMNGDARIAKVISLLGKGGKAYGSKNAGVIDLVSDLHDQFKKDMNEQEVKCMNIKNNYGMEVQSLLGEQESQQQTHNTKELAQTEQNSKAQTEGANAQQARRSAENAQKDVNSVKRSQKKREATHHYIVDEANKMINGLALAINNVHGKQGGNFIQLSDAPQLKETIVNLLDDGALTYKSRVLAQLAVRVSSAGGFKKIREMIEDMIANLSKEAAEDAAKNAGCVTDLAKGREDKTQANNAKEKADGAMSSYKAKMEDAQTNVEDANASLKDKEQYRGRINDSEAKRKARFGQSIRQLEQSQSALENAISNMKNTQNALDEAAGEKLGPIIEILEGVEGDVSADITSEKETNTKSINDHAEDLTNTEAAIAGFTQERAFADKARAEAEESFQAEEQKFNEASDNVQLAQQSLDATNELCRPPPVPLKERLAQRNNEIDQLNKVMKVLRGAHN